jgi:hypothetical protein
MFLYGDIPAVNLMGSEHVGKNEEAVPRKISYLLTPVVHEP